MNELAQLYEEINDWNSVPVAAGLEDRNNAQQHLDLLWKQIAALRKENQALPEYHYSEQHGWQPV